MNGSDVFAGLTAGIDVLVVTALREIIERTSWRNAGSRVSRVRVSHFGVFSLKPRG